MLSRWRGGIGDAGGVVLPNPVREGSLRRRVHPSAVATPSSIGRRPDRDGPRVALAPWRGGPFPI